MNIGLKTRFRPLNNSAAKRINMYLRWMVRQDTTGVDLEFGKASLLLPCLALRCAFWKRSSKLGLLTRKQNDGKALTELDLQLRQFEPSDPVKYDFALFG
jgi:uncharacterized protein (TIGR02757 family)